MTTLSLAAFAGCVALLWGAFASEVAALVPLLNFQGLYEEAQQLTGRKALSADPAIDVAMPSIDGAVPIPFAWGGEEITTPEMDSSKYQFEIGSVLDDPIGEWAVLPEELVMSDTYTLAVRPLEVAGLEPTQLLMMFQAEFKSPGGRTFFDFLVTPEGQLTITEPNSQNEAASREAGLKTEGPEGATVFTTAQAITFPTRTVIAEVSTHWQTCGPNELTYMAYPASVPFENRLPTAQVDPGLENVTEYSIVFAERVRQIDPETIQFKSIQWVELIPPFPNPSSYSTLTMFYGGLYGRLLEHFDTTEYPAPTGDECPMEGGSYGDVGGYGE